MENPNHITISAIAALGNQRQIGKGNDLLWNLPEDLKRFKKLTNGKAVIMGRKTWESLPDAVRPLPNRENIILTRDKNYDAPGGVVVHDLDTAITLAKKWSIKNNEDEVFIIGGANIYLQALPKTDKLYLTLVDSDKDGDVFFPEYEDEFAVIDKKDNNVNDHKFSFVSLKRK